MFEESGLIEPIDEEIPSWQQPHGRFIFPTYSRNMAGLDPTSYHNLPIAVTDSYLEDGLCHFSIIAFFQCL